MDRIWIEGGTPLFGTVNISGSKNAALPILFASLLAQRDSCFFSVPDLRDIRMVENILKELGAEVRFIPKKNQFTVHPATICRLVAPYDWVRKMRASILLLGPLLAKFHRAQVSLPGGCAIGARPVDLHLRGLKKLGASIELEAGNIIACAHGGLHGAEIVLDFPSVGATENLLMAASLAKGETLIRNAAKEPEIVELANVLSSMGVPIEGAGTAEVRIQGRKDLKGARYRIFGDRIEAGTFLIAAFGSRGKVRVCGVKPIYLKKVLLKLQEAGAEISEGTDWIELEAKRVPLPTDIVTQPYPGFPTDMQAQFMSLMCLAKGKSRITETIFENRFMHVLELGRLGAEIQVQGKTATVTGGKVLKGAPVMATDLRASASLILGGLFAQGKTLIHRVYHLDRGYEKIEIKLKNLGAQIGRIFEKEGSGIKKDEFKKKERKETL